MNGAKGRTTAHASECETKCPSADAKRRRNIFNTDRFRQVHVDPGLGARNLKIVCSVMRVANVEVRGNIVDQRPSFGRIAVLVQEFAENPLNVTLDEFRLTSKDARDLSIGAARGN